MTGREPIAAPKSIAALRLTSFGADLNVAIIGATGGIGAALASELAACPAVKNVHRLSRAGGGSGEAAGLPIDLEDERSIEKAAHTLREIAGSLDIVVTATGILHDGDGLQPEKSWRTMSAPAMQKAFLLNATGPALVAKHFLPLLSNRSKLVFAALSARVGSIEDNQFGGWYAYRASKAALNMLIKSLSIELARRNPAALCVGLHPGTIDTKLSKPFQRSVPEGQLFSARTAARHLLTVLDGLTVEDTGNCYAWDGTRIPF
jgi:NAD(P)-dependent dehydrogenase (short-subunit alcohol dehydrogenase family)